MPSAGLVALRCTALTLALALGLNSVGRAQTSPLSEPGQQAAAAAGLQLDEPLYRPLAAGAYSRTPLELIYRWLNDRQLASSESSGRIPTYPEPYPLNLNLWLS